ncbi:hypothetical protein MXC99_14035 [Thauera aromatica]|uniref:hypothetical protein n=1 Tax=Thauera aromatica TaxID=59405 RepID=UPI001FFDD4D3|nr:hypothetical protein [Thauera aromatica]MCK2089293.1 hypothetical protein [Thauera aromatica]MCK2125971.1 hypothetical protein [Thauera aromatica]
MLDIVLFRSGPAVCGIEARHVGTSRLCVAGDEAPATIESVLGLAPVRPRAPVRLALRAAGGMREVLADGPLELLRVEVTDIVPLPPLIEAMKRSTTLKGLAVAGDRVLALFGPADGGAGF